MKDRPSFAKSAETERAIKVLRATSPGEIITYAKLKEVIGEDPQVYRNPIQSARKTLLNDGYVFCTVINVGLKRLDDSEIVQSESTTPARMTRMVRKSMKKLSVVKPEALTGSDRMTYAVTSAALGAIALCSSRKSVSKIEQAVRDNDDGKLEIADTLKLFQ